MCFFALLDDTEKLRARMHKRAPVTGVCTFYKIVRPNRVNWHYSKDWAGCLPVRKVVYRKGEVIKSNCRRLPVDHKNRKQFKTRFYSGGYYERGLTMTTGIYVYLQPLEPVLCHPRRYLAIKVKAHVNDLIGANEICNSAVFRKVEVVS